MPVVPVIASVTYLCDVMTSQVQHCSDMRQKTARSLIIKLNRDSDFDKNSLELTYGFSSSVILGASGSESVVILQRPRGSTKCLMETNW